MSGLSMCPTCSTCCGDPWHADTDFLTTTELTEEEAEQILRASGDPQMPDEVFEAVERIVTARRSNEWQAEALRAGWMPPASATLTTAREDSDAEWRP